ncbi:enolase 4-like [Huso huso]|uniref:Enolase 4 n=1 Tax=Huso huso TaxID=61971 RepID=A0ABR0ZS39_HUSHU
MSYSGFLNNNRHVSKEVREFYELKQRAAEYYRTNGVPEKIEDVLNSMFYKKPDDVYGYLANYFSNFSKPPRISNLVGKEVYDGKGQPAVQVEVLCTIQSNEKRICSAAISSHCEPPGSDYALPEAWEMDDTKRKESVSIALQWINKPLAALLKGHEPADQLKADTLLSDFFQVHVAEKQAQMEEEKKQQELMVAVESEPLPPPQPSPAANKKEKRASGKGKKTSVPEKPIPPAEPQQLVLPGSMAVGSVSLAVCKAAAILSSIPLFQHIFAINHQQQMMKDIQMPIPMISLLSCGKSSPGKLNLMKEVIVIPKPGLTFRQSFNILRELQKQMIKLMDTASKTGPILKTVSDLGALVIGFERLEQPLDLIREASKTLELTVGEDLHLAINCAAHELIDYQKGKYEVMTGTPKNPNEMVDLYVDLISRYPAVIALIDPLRKEDKEQWNKLYTAVSSKCYLLAETASKPISSLLVEEDLTVPGFSGVILKQTNQTTVSDMIEINRRMRDQKRITVFGTTDGESSDDSLADLAVGVGARFIKLGGLCRGERVTKYCRLLSIEDELARQGALGPAEKHEFPVLTGETEADPPSQS